jgi:hypothetical protein
MGEQPRELAAKYMTSEEIASAFATIEGHRSMSKFLTLSEFD